MRILICDDVRPRAEETGARIKAADAGVETKILAEDELTDQIRKLFDRALSVLAPKSTPVPTPSTFECEDYDIAILDNNLSELNIEGARHTAESIAGYVRAFGRIPYVVSLNKNLHVDFDLRYLVGDYHTQADIALNEKHLSIPALWKGIPVKDQFLPWYWPAMKDVASRRRQQIAFVEEHLDDPILKALNFPKSAGDRLSRRARGALHPEAQSVWLTTFRKFFVVSCRSLPVRREREKLARSIASSDDPTRDVLCRVVAGEFDKWIRRHLLGPQDVLVDIPHLLMRMPFLLGVKSRRLSSWNEVVTATKSPYGLSARLYRRHLKVAEFAHCIWTKSPCFWWTTLKSDEELNGMFFRNRARWASAAFCEDLSQFKEYRADKDQPQEFAAETEGSWARRYVQRVNGWSYTPISRFAK